jgi:hypothetical protein
MDQEILVKAGHQIVSELEKEGAIPRAAIWVHATDTDTWKLWILPHQSIKDTREFYRRLSTIVTGHRTELAGVDAADVELISDSNPIIKAMRDSRAFHVTGQSVIHVKNSTFNGFYLAEAIILQMTL